MIAMFAFLLLGNDRTPGTLLVKIIVFAHFTSFQRAFSSASWSM